MAAAVALAAPGWCQTPARALEQPPPTGEVSVPDNTHGGVASANRLPAVTSAPKSLAAPVRSASATPNAARAKESSDQSGDAVDSPFGGFGGKSNHGPININSDQLNLDYKNNTVFFTGHVHAVQSGSELTSNTLRVKYGKDFHQVQEMVADGNVRMSQGQRWATGDHAVLDESKHTMVLTGSPVVHDGRDQIAGTMITVFLQTGKSEVEHPKAVIFPREAKSQDNSSGQSGAGATADKGSATAADPASDK
jgi:lipopolysaccharide export system protein LptA